MELLVWLGWIVGCGAMMFMMMRMMSGTRSGGGDAPAGRPPEDAVEARARRDGHARP